MTVEKVKAWLERLGLTRRWRQDPATGPSYHDLYITTELIPRTSISRLPFAAHIICTRCAGWELWEKYEGSETLLAGEYAGPRKGLRLDIGGTIILDSLTPREASLERGGMTVEILTPASREEWLEARTSTIGASESACLFGAHPYQTAYGLWAAKTGRLPVDTEETPPMRRGRMLEEVAVRFLREERPDWIVQANPIPGGRFFSDTEVGLSCTPDAFVHERENEGFGVVQIKSVEPGIFRSKWKGEDGEIVPPLHVAIQAVQEAHLTGAARAYVAPLVIGFGVEMPLLEVPLHAGLIEALQERAGEFWALVADGGHPDPDWKRDAALAAQLHAFDERTLDLSGSNILPALLTKRARRKAYIKAASAWCDEAEGEVRLAIGPSTIAVLPGWRITCKPEETRAYQVAARTKRPLRITKTKEKH